MILALLPLVLIVILIVLIAKTTTNSTKIRNLEWEIKKLHDLERHVNELSSNIDVLKKGAEEPGPGSSRRREAEPATSLIPQTQSAAPTSKEKPSTAPSQSPIREMAEPAAPSRTREEWEALIGGKLLNRIGALALIIGIGFFLKYAFDNNWINEATRILIGVAVGILCLYGGYRTHKREFKVFAQGMTGAGIAILYLSVYAAFNYYHLLPQWVAFVFMSIVTLIAFLNGLFYDSLAEGVLGWAGGFLTPIMLSTGQANETGLFAYISLLDAGLVAMVIKREKWAILEPLAFIGTWLMYITWRSEFYNDADLWLTVFFVTVFWVLFLVPDVLRSRKSTPDERFKQIVPVFNALFYFLAMYFLVDEGHHAWMGLITLAIGAVYVLIFLAQQRRGGMRNDVKVQYTLTAAALLVIATSIQFNGFNTVIAWSIEAAILMWCSKEWNERYVQTAAAVLFGCTILKLFGTTGGLEFTPIREYALLLNHRALAFAILAASLGFGAFIIDRSGPVRDRYVANGLHIAWCVIVFLLATVETNDFFRFRMLDQLGAIVQRLEFFRVMSYAVVWIILSLPIAWAGLQKTLLPVVISGLVFAFLAAIFGVARGIAYDPIADYTPFFNIRAITLLLVFTGLLLHTQLMQRGAGGFGLSKSLPRYIQTAMLVVVFVLLTGETRDFFQKDIVAMTQAVSPSSLEMQEASRLSNPQQMCLSGVWLLYSAVMMAAGLWRKNRGMRVGAILLFGVSILKIFIYDLSSLETLYRIFSFLALGVILIAVSFAYQKYKDVIVGKV